MTLKDFNIKDPLSELRYTIKKTIEPCGTVLIGLYDKSEMIDVCILESEAFEEEAMLEMYAKKCELENEVNQID